MGPPHAATYGVKRSLPRRGGRGSAYDRASRAFSAASTIPLA